MEKEENGNNERNFRKTKKDQYQTIVSRNKINEI
jgi:hypothetical protein